MTINAPEGIITLGVLGGRVIMTSYPSVDPTVAPGVDAPVGSLYLRDTASASTNLYTKIGLATTDWASPGGGGGGTINELWGPRTAPHPADDEFNTNALAADWQQTGFGGVLNFAVRPAIFTAPADNPASWENLRDPDNTTDPTQNTWLRIQPGNGPAGIWKRLDGADFGGAVPANLLAWARFRFGWVNEQAPGAADTDIALTFFEEGGGGFSFAVHATIALNETQEGTPNEIKPLFWGRNGAAVTALSEGTAQNAPVTNKSVGAFYSGYVALLKEGADTYHAFVIDDGGRLFMGSYNNAGLVGINAIAIWCRGNAMGALGIPIFDIDFVRFYEGIDWIP